MSHRSTVWKGDGRDPVCRPPNRSTSTPFCKVATTRFTAPAIKLLPHVIDTTRRTDTPGDHAWVDVTHPTLRAATVPQRRVNIRTDLRFRVNGGARDMAPDDVAILDRCRAPIFTPTSAESPAWRREEGSGRGVC